MLVALRRYSEFVVQNGMYIGRYKDLLIVEKIDGSLRGIAAQTTMTCQTSTAKYAGTGANGSKKSVTRSANSRRADQEPVLGYREWPDLRKHRYARKHRISTSLWQQSREHITKNIFLRGPVRSDHPLVLTLGSTDRCNHIPQKIAVCYPIGRKCRPMPTLRGIAAEKTLDRKLKS